MAGRGMEGLEEEHDATGAVAGLIAEEATLLAEDALGEDALGEDRGISPALVSMTLTMSVVGTGLLSLPSAFRCLGVMPALATLVLVSVAMLFTGDMMIRSYLAAPKDADSYEGLATHSCRVAPSETWRNKERFARVLVNSVNGVGLFGGCCAYIAIGKDIFPTLVEPMKRDHGDKWYLETDYITLVLLVTISFPLCLLRNLSSLRYSSIVGFLFSVYMILVISGRGFSDLFQGEARWRSLWSGECEGENAWNSFVAGVSIFNFSFVYHFNILPLFRNLPHKSRNLATMRKVLQGTTVSCVILYASIGVGGYAHFGVNVKGNILSNFSASDNVINFARVAVCACCFLCLPLLEHPLRGTVLALFSVPNTPKSRFVSTVLLLFLQYLVALVAPGIKELFQLTGGSAVVGFCYVFPVCFALAIVSRRPQVEPMMRTEQQDVSMNERLLRDSPSLSRLTTIEEESESEIHSNYSKSSVYLDPSERLLCWVTLLFFPLCGTWSLFIKSHS